MKRFQRVPESLTRVQTSDEGERRSGAAARRSIFLTESLEEDCLAGPDGSPIDVGFDKNGEIVTLK